jgi:alpha-L-rhamnosidase
LKQVWWFAATLGLLVWLSLGQSAVASDRSFVISLKPAALRCEYAVNPLGVDTAAPRLSWTLESDRRSQYQTAYEVCVTDKSGLLWDSGKLRSDRTQQIAYAGRPLQSAQQVFWRVRVWDKQDHVSPWSRPAWWTMGLLRESDWQGARWIGTPAAVPAWSSLIGYHAAETTNGDDAKWVQVDLGRAVSISTVRLFPMQHAGKDGFGFPLRYRVEASDDADFSRPQMIADRTAADELNPGLSPVAFGAHGVTGRYVRVTATKLWKRDATVYAFALHRLEVDSGDRDLAAGSPVTAKDSAEFGGWGKTALTAFASTSSGSISGSIPAKAKQTDSLLLRRLFTVKPHLTRALAFVCGLGQYVMSVNGVKAGKDVLAPGWTKYDKTCLYDTRDLTPLLRPGENTVGLLLGNGMYNVHGGRYTKFTGSFGPQKAICSIRLEYADRSVQTIVSDDAWHTSPGPITFSSVYGGEDYDARLLPSGWDQPRFSDSHWDRAMVLSGPGGELRGLDSAGPPLRTFEEFTPVAVKQLKPGVTVYDLGQNAAIMPRLVVSGPAGSVVQITPSELVHPDGSLDRASVGDAPAYWKYTLAGTGVETYFSPFFYHGCRYLQIDLSNPAGGALPTVSSLKGVVIGSDSPPVGQFTCSNDLFNRISTLIRWAQRSNMVSVMTDCPHRERLGWLEEDHLNGPSLRYGFDLNQLFRKITNDMADSQTGDGLVPSIAPEYPVFSGGFRDSPEWGSAFLLVPWQQYEFTGDLSLLERHYGGMKRYVTYLSAKSKDGIVDYGLGDWYDIGPRPPGPSQQTPIALTATAFYYQDALILARAAALLGHAEDAQQYGALAEQIKAAFNAKFRHADTGLYATGSQTANAIPFVMGLAPAGDTRPVAGIIADIHKRGMALTAGDIGYRYLLQALAQGGRADVIFAMNDQSDKPGYGCQLKTGATSLTEAWDALRSSSQNHFMLGQIMEWFYGGLAGIQPDPSGPGFEKIIIKPSPVGDITWAQARYDSVRGRIVSAWKRDGTRLTLAVTIPANTTATVYVPTDHPDGVMESGHLARHAPGVVFLKSDNGYSVYHIGSGQYVFTALLSAAGANQ